MPTKKNTSIGKRGSREAAVIGAFPATAVERPYKKPSVQRLRDDTQNSTSYAKSLVTVRNCPEIIHTPGPNAILKPLL